MAESWTVLFWKFVKFCAVGFSGMLVDFGSTWLLKEKLGIQKFVANAIGFMLAASTNYVLNRIWTFESTNPSIATEYTNFIIVSFIGLGINTLALWFLLKKTKGNFYVCKFIAILITTLWNFVANLVYTF